ncbi:MAG TPA: hypothetical protein VHZ24_05505 [Pirellulales bacterium]|jgi:hypothetical protein|nr:hypothetical protein [Pirellulales bacterium]
MLDREEYIEQAYFFRALGQRMQSNQATQDLLASLREEVLATTRLPLALDFLASELRHSGVLAPAMQRLDHYFTPFQAFVVAEAERERGRFDFLTALEILEREAQYRADSPTPQGLFIFQFECLCRNRLGYDHGLGAMARDPIYDEAWREWILIVRRQVGLVDFAELLYVRSAHYANQRARKGIVEPEAEDKPALFGEKEGMIALAHRRKDPLWLFAALERQLGYPTVPRAKRPDESKHILPLLVRRMERVEQRIKLLEEEGRGGIDLSRFMPGPTSSPPDDS